MIALLVILFIMHCFTHILVMVQLPGISSQRKILKHNAYALCLSYDDFNTGCCKF